MSAASADYRRAPGASQPGWTRATILRMPTSPTSMPTLLRSAMCRERDFSADWYLRWKDKMAAGAPELALDQQATWGAVWACKASGCTANCGSGAPFPRPSTSAACWGRAKPEWASPWGTSRSLRSLRPWAAASSPPTTRATTRKRAGRPPGRWPTRSRQCIGRASSPKRISASASATAGSVDHF